MRKLTLVSAFAAVAVWGCSSTTHHSPRSVAATNASQTVAADLPGPRGGNTIRLPNQWWLKPAGKQVALGDFPVHIALHPSSDYAAILHCGHGQNEIVIVDLPEGKIISRAAVEEAFYGITFS